MGGGRDEPTPDRDLPDRDAAGDTSRQGPSGTDEDAADAAGTDTPDTPDGPDRDGRDPGQDRSDRSDQESVELRQIDELNRLDPLPTAHLRPDRPPPRDDRPPGQDADARLRDAVLLTTGHEVAEADSLADVLRVLSRLRAPGFELDGMVVFGVTEKFLNGLGQYGFQPFGSERTVRIPVTTHYPAVDVLRTGRPVYLSSPDEYRARYPTMWPLTESKDRKSWAFMPLVATGRITAVWLAAFAEPVTFTPEQRSLLTAAARLVAQSLERTRTGEAELALSRGLRRSMGSAEPAYPGLSVATRYVPTGGGLMVGGDWYDIINLPTGRVALVIGDVQGHDVHAAGLMTQLRTAVHAYAAEGHGPDAVMSRASHFLTALDEDRFATCIYIEADPATGVLQIARAGHPHPVLRIPDGTCMIKHIRGGLPLGLMPDSDDYPVNVLELRPDEVMLLCTDGLIETGGHDMYTGWVRVRDALSPGPATDIEGMADRLIAAVGTPQPDAEDIRLSPRNEDDIALLLLRRDGGVPQPGVPERRLVLTIEQDQAEGLAEARTELRALLHDWARPDQVDTAVLLASEVLGNVLVHTEQPAALVAIVTGNPGRRTLRVEVTDTGDELPHQRAPGELASSGRGLVLLDLLSDQWGVRPEPAGKTVWFALHEAGGPDGE
ncbi:SpoIIE family protein phosphatase [Streptomyces sp. NBC_01476]|uniref:ATP-binding SpoIIE family protein phosphatase n=1 Tax=Streptomyces sp. NBC_01476 TaxID=2903881 RepID=UPI002E3319E6|nr:SpoIIE family protein phosphatase [Streptomyces sp. NBC_01476]